MGSWRPPDGDGAVSRDIYSPFLGRSYPDPEASAWAAAASAFGRLFTDDPPKPAILAAEEGDLIEVVQPDGERETYRLTGRKPAADGWVVTFETERVEAGEVMGGDG